MPYAPIDSGEICFETYGTPSHPPLLLLEGAFTQLIGWPPEFVRSLSEAGCFVIATDHRDSGLSSHFGGEADLDGGYGIEDLAGDALAVLDHLGLDSAHVIGRSMGGMVAQQIAITQPSRVRSLALFFSTPGQSARHVLHPDRTEFDTVQPRYAKTELIDFALASHFAAMPDGDAWGDRAWYADEIRRYVGDAYDRRYSPDGAARQWNALRRAPDRLEALGDLELPVALLHGREDPLLHWRASADMAAAIPGSDLHLFAGMGHGFPPALIPTFVQILIQHVRRAEYLRSR